MDEQVELMVKYLVHLQFYSEEGELLFSRDKKSSIHIPGISSIVSAFVSELLRPINHVRAGEYRMYLNEVSKVIPLNIDAIETEFNGNISQLPENQLTPELIVNFLVGPIRSSLQNHEFGILMTRILETAANKLRTGGSEEVIENRIKELYSRNEESVALLYNLVFLRFLIKIYGDDDLYDRVNDLVNNYQEQLVSLLLTM